MLIPEIKGHAVILTHFKVLALEVPPNRNLDWRSDIARVSRGLITYLDDFADPPTAALDPELVESVDLSSPAAVDSGLDEFGDSGSSADPPTDVSDPEPGEFDDLDSSDLPTAATVPRPEELRDMSISVAAVPGSVEFDASGSSANPPTAVVDPELVESVDCSSSAVVDSGSGEFNDLGSAGVDIGSEEFDELRSSAAGDLGSGKLLFAALGSSGVSPAAVFDPILERAFSEELGASPEPATANTGVASGDISRDLGSSAVSTAVTFSAATGTKPANSDSEAEEAPSAHKPSSASNGRVSIASVSDMVVGGTHDEPEPDV